MNKTLSTLLLLLTILAVQAQPTDDRASEARAVLDQMATKNNSYATIEAAFTLTIDNRQSNIKNVHEGTIKVKGQKYILDILGTRTYFDGRTIYSWVKDADEVNISEPSPDDDSALTPTKMFGSYETGYKLRYRGEVETSGTTCDEVELFPEERGGNIARIKIDIDKQSSNIKTLMQQGKDGISYTVEITKLITDKTIDDKEFVFDRAAHPDVEVIDMR